MVHVNINSILCATIRTEQLFLHLDGPPKTRGLKCINATRHLCLVSTPSPFLTRWHGRDGGAAAIAGRLGGASFTGGCSAVEHSVGLQARRYQACELEPIWHNGAHLHVVVLWTGHFSWPKMV